MQRTDWGQWPHPKALVGSETDARVYAQHGRAAYPASLVTAERKKLQRVGRLSHLEYAYTRTPVVHLTKGKPKQGKNQELFSKLNKL